MKPPILFNRLGSDIQVQKSVIGQNGVLSGVGASEYSSVKFDDGFRNTTALGAADFNNVPISCNTSTIEHWIKFTQTPAAQANIAPWGNGEAAQTFPDIRMYRVASINTWILLVQPVSGKFAQLRISDANMSFTASGDIVHWGFVIDASGGAGAIATGSDVLAIYVNGVIVSSFVLDNVVGSPTYADFQGASKTDKFAVSDDTSSGYSCNAYIDNIKIYDYAKTDFSDRFNERGGLNDVAVIV